MADFADLLKKLASQSRLTPQELADLGRFGTETQLRNSFVAGNTTAQNVLDIKFPFFPIFSEILQQDTASLSIPIPSGYKHLMIWGQGRASSANGGTIWAQLNGDTNSANYYDTYILGNGAAVSSGNQNFAQIPLGVFSNSGDPANRAAQFDCRILNYASAWHKMSLNQTYYNDDVTRGIYVFGGLWKSTSAINSMEIFVTDNTSTKGTANLVAGSVLSVYGVQ